MLPLRRSIRTLDIPVPAVVRVRRTGQRSDSASQPASRSVLGLSEAPLTVTWSTFSYGAWSSVAASRPRQMVNRVHARSESPGR